MKTTTSRAGFCIVRTRKFYGPDYKYSLVCEMTEEGDETGKVTFATREEAQSVLNHEEEATTRGYGCYSCSHNESGSPDYQIVSVNAPRAKRLLRELAEVYKNE